MQFVHYAHSRNSKESQTILYLFIGIASNLHIFISPFEIIIPSTCQNLHGVITHHAVLRYTKYKYTFDAQAFIKYRSADTFVKIVSMFR